ncbi:MAG: hypothetical protein DMF79_07130 [Acidobacteria bacterium]|nr:MAG: hypothetical protein DMF79_07130 [Acidobacteriota bacterium]
MKRRNALVILLLAAGAVTRLEAQVLYGSIVGSARDSSGAGVPGAAVSITHLETRLSRETVTDAAGAYAFSTVPTGTYALKVSLPGFKSFSRPNVPVTLNSVTRVDAALQVGQVTGCSRPTGPRSGWTSTATSCAICPSPWAGTTSSSSRPSPASRRPRTPTPSPPTPPARWCST